MFHVEQLRPTWKKLLYVWIEEKVVSEFVVN